jgi:glycosyltransferase involved in cell wall biosynthesis
MKVLWITNNIIFPDACDYLGIRQSTAGGWMYSAAKALQKNNTSLDLGVIAVSPSIKEFAKFSIRDISYYCIPGDFSEKNSSFEKYCRLIKEEFTPDVVHIHGSEFSLGLAYLNACGSKNVVMSIQGLVSVYERYFYAGVSLKDMFINTTAWDLYTKSGFFFGKKNYHKRGLAEIEYFNKLEHIIGRTDWDKIHTWALNPKANYYFCNETLRTVFYGKNWTYENCEKYSIFLSQARYPIKGLHQVLKALSIVVRSFPKAKIYVALSVDVYPDSLKGKIKTGGYALYLRRLIEQLNLKDKVFFLGALSAEEMCNQYLKSNLFISPASIENSPNSLGEAQLLGVPCIASNVGGTENIMDFGKCGKMYRFEEYEQMAYYISRIFKNGFIQEEVDHAKVQAENRHDAIKNAERLVDIYKQIVS